MDVGAVRSLLYLTLARPFGSRGRALTLRHIRRELSPFSFSSTHYIYPISRSTPRSTRNTSTAPNVDFGHQEHAQRRAASGDQGPPLCDASEQRLSEWCAAHAIRESGGASEVSRASSLLPSRSS